MCQSATKCRQGPNLRTIKYASCLSANCKVKKYLFILPLLLTPAYASIVSEGEYRFGPDTSENYACYIAEERAKQNAISQFIGEKIDVVVEENCLNNFCNQHQQTFNSVEGNLKSMSVIDRKIGDSLGYKYCKIKIKTEVEELKNDIHFTVSGNFNYTVGQNVNFNIVSNKSGNIVLFNYYNDVYHKIYEHDLVDKQSETVIPSNNVALVATLDQNQYQSKEGLLFLFHQTNKVFKDIYTKTEMENLISSIPSNSRRIVKRYINIKR